MTAARALRAALTLTTAAATTWAVIRVLDGMGLGWEDGT